jgi:hypothetical protein
LSLSLKRVADIEGAEGEAYEGAEGEAYEGPEGAAFDEPEVQTPEHAMLDEGATTGEPRADTVVVEEPTGEDADDDAEG